MQLLEYYIEFDDFKVKNKFNLNAIVEELLDILKDGIYEASLKILIKKSNKKYNSDDVLYSVVELLEFNKFLF